MRPWLGKIQTAAAVLLLLIGAALLLLPRFFAPLAPQPRTDGAQVLSDLGSPMTLAVCSVSSARRAALRNADLVSNIINALPPRIKIVLLVNDRKAFTVAANPWPDRVTFVELPADKAFTIWPQDPFLVLQNAADKQPGGRRSDQPQPSGRILVSRNFSRADDRIMARAIAEHVGWPLEEATFDFEGGNILADERYVFVGGNTIRHNAIAEGLSDAVIAERFQQQLGREVIVVGPVPQPIGHIDLMLTPLGGGRLVLADPGEGARLVEENLAATPDQVREFEQRCETLYFGDPQVKQLVDEQGQVMRPPEVVGETVRAIEHSRQIAPILDRLADDLRGRGFEIHRLPMLFLPTDKPHDDEVEQPSGNDEQDANNPDETEARVGYPYLTYNNVLLETDGERRIVYLPQYGLPVLDTAARLKWQALGFELHLVRGLEISAMYGGSLRCCVKVLARE